MSATIDRRIVEMQFNNKQFEKGIGESVESLALLKKSLQLDGAADSLKELQRAGKAFTLSSIADSVDAISQRFTTMGIIGMRTLQNIADSAYRAGKRMMNALTVQPVKMGFGEYETQINAIQTILANTRTEMKEKGYNEAQSLDVITQKLDELNTYADQTIYNFTEMTRNIGTFTAAGVELDKSVAAIKGMSNLAAISGSTPQQASNAMYQMSQALSSGVVRAIDWNSMVNAGMGGEVFKNALINTARAMGIQVDHTVDKINEKGKLVKETVKMNVDQVIAADGGFKESLQSEWLTADVMIATLNQFSIDLEKTAREMGYYLQDGTLDLEAAKNEILGDLYSQGFTEEQAEEIIELAEMAKDAATEVKTLTQLFSTLNESLQSGWTQSWEYILGNFNEVKAFLTDVSNHFGDMIQASADARNKVLLSWKNMGGRDLMIESFWNIVTAIENVVNTIRGAFQEFFPPATAEQLYSVTEGINDFTEKIKMATENTELMDKVGRVFRGVAAGIDIVRKAVRWAASGLADLLGMSGGLAEWFLNMAAGLGDLIAGFTESEDGVSKFGDILEKARRAISSVWNSVSSVIKKAGSMILGLWNSIVNTGIFSKLHDWFGSFLDAIPQGAARLQEFISSFIDFITTSKELNAAWNGVKQFFGKAGDIIASVWKRISGLAEAFFGADVSGLSFGEGLKVRFQALGEEFSKLVDEAKVHLMALWERIKAFFTRLFTVTIPEYMKDLWARSVEKWPWLQNVADFLMEMWEALLPTLDHFKGVFLDLWEKLCAIFTADADRAQAGKTLLESVTEVLSDFWEQVKAAFSTFFNETVPQWWEKIKGIDWKSIIPKVLGITSLIAAFKLIRGFGKLGKGFGSLGDGLKGLGEMLEELKEEGLNVNHIFKKKDTLGTALLKIATSIAILVASISVLANMETEKAIKGLGLLGVMMISLLGFTALFRLINANGDALLKAAASMVLMLIPLKVLSDMETKPLMKGIFWLGVLLLELAVAMRIAGKAAKAEKGESFQKQSFLGMTAGVLLLVGAVELLGSMPLGKAVQGLAALEIIFLELQYFLNSTKDAAKQKKGFIFMSLGILLLVESVKKLGAMDFGSLVKGVGGLFVILESLRRTFDTHGGEFGIGKGIGEFIAVAGILWALGRTLKKVEKLGVFKSALFMYALSKAITAFGRMIGQLAYIPTGTVALVVVKLGIVFAGITGLVWLLGQAADNWEGFLPGIESGGKALEAIGRAIGRLLHGFIKGTLFGEGEPPKMEFSWAQFGKDLSDFITNASGFIKGVPGVNQEVLDATGRLAGVILTIAGTEVLTALSSLITWQNPIERFGWEMQTLAKALVTYGLITAPLGFIPKTSLERSVDVASSLADVANKIPVTGAIASLFSGVGSLGDFAGNLGALGSGLVEFAKNSQQIASMNTGEDSIQFDEGKIDSVLRIAQKIAELESSLEAQGGIEDIIEGDKLLTFFSGELPSFGDGMNKFITECQKIVYDPETDNAKIEGVIGFAAKLAELERGVEAQGGWVDEIVGIKSLDVFGAQIPAFAESMNGFIEECKKINFDPTDGSSDMQKLEATIAIATKLSELEKSLEAQGGKADEWLGVKSLETFGGEFKPFAYALDGFVSEINQITTEELDSGKVEKAIAVAKSLNELNHALVITNEKDSEGTNWHNFWFGTQDLGLFADNVKAVGSALASFYTDVNGIPDMDGEAEEAVSALDVMDQFVKKLDPSGGMWDTLSKAFGDGSSEYTLLNMASNMETVGRNLASFSNSAKEIDPESVGQIDKIAQKVYGLLEGTESSGSFWQNLEKFFGGDAWNTINTMGDNLGRLGDNLGRLTAGTVGIEDTYESFGTVGTLVDEFAQLKEKVDQSGVWQDYDKIDGVINKLDEFGNFAVTFSQNFKDNQTDLSLVRTAANIVKTLVEITRIASEADPNSVGRINDILYEYGNLDMGGLVRGFAMASDEVVEVVTELFNAISEAVAEGDKLSAAANKTAYSAAMEARSQHGAFYNTGKYFGEGMALGIRSMASSVRASAVSAAAGAIHAIQISWAIHSPSRVTREFGKNFDFGLIEGIDGYSGMVIDSAQRVAEGAADGFGRSMNLLSGLEEELDYSPHIRPVLDLDDVINGMHTMDGMFASGRHIRGYFNGGISIDGMRGMRQDRKGEVMRTDNRDVVDAIHELSGRFEDMNLRLENMQIVLDSGALVGHTSAQMDAKLGALASRRGRGN